MGIKYDKILGEIREDDSYIEPISYNKGYFATELDLTTAYPTGSAGDYAIIGSTDTVWIWDTDTNAWIDSGLGGAVTSVNGQTGDVSLYEVNYYIYNSIQDIIGYSPRKKIITFSDEGGNPGSREIILGQADLLNWNLKLINKSTVGVSVYDYLGGLQVVIHPGFIAEIQISNNSIIPAYYNPGLVGTKEVDETDIADGKLPVFRAASGKYELETISSGGSGGNIVFQDYGGQAVIGILGNFDAETTGTLVEATLICDTLPVGSNLICELRKNSTTTGNVLNATLQVTTTESATNGRYKGTPVTSFTSTAIADGDVFYAYLTGVGSTTPATNARLILRYS